MKTNPTAMTRPAYENPNYRESRLDISDVEELADQLDTRFRLPGGFRVGWDGLLGLIPGVGDLVTNGISFYIIFRAADAGCPPSVLLRMALNVLVDNLIDAIPFLGNIFDFFWKANSKNLELLRRYTFDPRRTTRSSRGVVFATLFAIAVLIFGTMALAAYLLYTLFRYLADSGATYY